MSTYVVERMTEKNYLEYITGGHGYNVETLYIEAHTAEEAVEKALADKYIVNKGYVKMLEELENENEARKEAYRARLEKEALAKAKRKEAEARKAEAKGMTLDEYRADKARKANITRVKNEIAKLEAELAKKKAYLAKIEG